MNQQNLKIYDIYLELAGIMTISGYCAKNAQKIAQTVKKYTGDFFDTTEILPDGTLVFTALCNDCASQHKTLAVDAHIDTVGFAVSKILPGGFLAVSACGGIDARILPSGECKVHCTDGSTLHGIFTSVPPHLSKENTAPALSDIYVDVGICDENTLKSLVKIGSPVSYATRPTLLANNLVSGPYLDDKLCAASAICAFSLADKQMLSCNVCLVLSAGEEMGGSGASAAAQKCFDAAIVLDVNFARDTGVEDYLSAPIGEGISISYCAGTSIKLTQMFENLLCENALPFTKIVEVTDTGTNATRLNCTNLGTPCVVASIPISYMHTPIETASLDDASVLSHAIGCALQKGLCVKIETIK